MMSDPMLEKFSVIMLDDIHERSVHSDILLGLLKKIRRKREDLKIIISSATLDAERIKGFMEEENFPSIILNVEGRQFPIDVHYLNTPCLNYVSKAAQICKCIHEEMPSGDVLVFLTGQEEIESFIAFFNNSIAKNDKSVKCLPLYGNLPMEAQLEIFEAPNKHTRKIVVSTNIAESSVTIDGIVYVVDSGFVKRKVHNFLNGFESLTVMTISKAAANQRAGRAGRVRDGVCYRLYTKEGYEGLFELTSPEILLNSLSDVFLQLMTLGVSNVACFDFLDRPSEECIIRSLENLFSLRIIDEMGKITKDIGYNVSEFPLEPCLSVMLLNSSKINLMKQRKSFLVPEKY